MGTPDVVSSGAAVLTWNLGHDWHELFRYPFLRNAFEAGAVVAVMCGVVGWFAILRGETFAAHSLANAAFPGAAGAALLGLPPLLGYFGFAIGGALLISLLAAADPGERGARIGNAAAVAAVQSLALAVGFLFVSLYRGVLGSLTSFLFGSFLGVTRGDVAALTLVATGVLAAVAFLGRPLLFVSLDPEVARAAGLPVRLVHIAFLVLLGTAVAAAATFTGVLLVFALLVVPPATAQLLTARPSAAISISVALGVAIVWSGLVVAFASNRPVGFCVTGVGGSVYLAVRLGATVMRRIGLRGAGDPHADDHSDPQHGFGPDPTAGARP